MATFRKLPLNTKSKIRLVYVPDTDEKPRQGEIIAIGPLLLSPSHVN